MGQAMNEQQNGFSRRSLAKGAAWTVPAVALAGAAPAMAASQDTYAGGVCQIFYGGGTVSQQNTQVFLGITSTAATIPKGTVVTWTVTLDGSTGYVKPSYMQVPNVNYTTSGGWTLSTSPATGTNIASGGSFTVTWTATADVEASALACGNEVQNGGLPALEWPDSGRPALGTGVTVTVASGGSAPAGGGTVNPKSLKWQVPRRISNSGGISSAPTRYISSSDGCYPITRYSYIAGNTAAQGTNGSSCGAGGNNSSTLYPDGTCRKVNITSGQASVPSTC